jgi:MFS family permease
VTTIPSAGTRQRVGDSVARSLGEKDLRGDDLGRPAADQRPQRRLVGEATDRADAHDHTVTRRAIPMSAMSRRRAWLRVCGVMFAVGWGANQFSSLLLAYKLHRGLSDGTGDALFGVYALGLIPALLILGPISDRRGRCVITCAAGLFSGVATVLLILGAHALVLLYLGRLLAGLCSGAAFAAGTAWVKELSGPPHDPGAGPQAGARRAAIALSAGFGAGPLVAGLLAQWAPDPLLTAYLPHLAVVALVLGPGLAAPETVTEETVASETMGPEAVAPQAAGPRSIAPPSRPARGIRVASAAEPRFRRVVAPAAPWVFIAPSVAFAALPALIVSHLGHFQVGFAALTAALTLGVGVAVQPLARRLEARSSGRGLTTGLVCALAGMLVSALAVELGSWPIALPADILFGAGYGLCLVSGLIEVQGLAAPGELASLTAIFYAITYVGFASPLVISELQHLLAGPVVLLCGAALAALALASVVGGLRPGAGPHDGTL